MFASDQRFIKFTISNTGELQYMYYIKSREIFVMIFQFVLSKYSNICAFSWKIGGYLRLGNFTKKATNHS